MRRERRRYLAGLAIVGLLAAIPGGGQAAGGGKMVVVGFDGLDPALVRRYMDEGAMPNFSALAASGGFRALKTTIPPQSPVAWATFITGQDPGGTNVFDFIARDPKTYRPYLSVGEVLPPKKQVKVPGLSWIVPMSKPETVLYRKGKTFWEHLASAGIPATILRAPANFPPVQSGRGLAGMGTPDILGGYGTFQYFTSEATARQAGEEGRVTAVKVINNRIDTAVAGPVNAFKEDRPATKIPLTVALDPKNRAARLSWGDQGVILREKTWSAWLPFSFDLGAGKAAGIGRFYLKEIEPVFRLYLSPINLDPLAPPFPISSPEGYARELAGKIGRYHTQGIPEDTAALKSGRLDESEFLEQARAVYDEQLKMFWLELDNLKKEKKGFLFGYFSGSDSIQHMFWGTSDPAFPGYDRVRGERHARVIPDVYRRMDCLLGEIARRIEPGTTLVVLSDHGFTSFYRSFNLNAWLRDAGYLALLDEGSGTEDMLAGVDWTGTRAYAVGLTALYLNLEGREGEGTVVPARARKLMEEIRAKLLAYRDPVTGQQPIHSVEIAADIYRGAHASAAPDLIVGYNRGWRGSWKTALGQTPDEVTEPNTARWSGDHCVAAELVPGVLLSNRAIGAAAPGLVDLAPTILREFGLVPPPEMTGKPLFE